MAFFLLFFLPITETGLDRVISQESSTLGLAALDVLGLAKRMVQDECSLKTLTHPALISRAGIFRSFYLGLLLPVH